MFSIECRSWIVKVGHHFYVVNAGSNTISGYRIDKNGKPSVFTEVMTGCFLATMSTASEEAASSELQPERNARTAIPVTASAPMNFISALARDAAVRIDRAIAASRRGAT